MTTNSSSYCRNWILFWGFITVLFIAILGLVVILEITDYKSPIPEIIPGNFSVTNFSIVDNRISGEWTISLVLKSPAKRAIVYNEIFVNVLYPHGKYGRIESVAGFDQRHHWVQGPNNQTAVTIYGSGNKEPVSHRAADSMTRDVIETGVLELELAIFAYVMGIMATPTGAMCICHGIRVLALPSQLAPMHATGSFNGIPVCGHTKHTAGIPIRLDE